MATPWNVCTCQVPLSMELSREAYWLLVLLSRFSHVRPHRRQPTRLHYLWDSPGKNTGVGCHFLLQCMKVKSESEVMSDSLRPQGLQPTRLLCPWDFPGKSTGVGCHCLLQSILEWVAIFFFRGSSRSRDQTQVSLIVGRCFTLWATREVVISEGISKWLLTRKCTEYIDIWAFRSHTK